MIARGLTGKANNFINALLKIELQRSFEDFGRFTYAKTKDLQTEAWTQKLYGALSCYFDDFRSHNSFWEGDISSVAQLRFSGLLLLPEDERREDYYFGLRYLAWAHESGEPLSLDWILAAIYALFCHSEKI